MKRGVALAVQILLNIFLFAGLAGVMYLCYLSGGGLTAGIVLLIAYALSLVLMPALHEAGHLLLGAAAGFRLAELRFSFVRILREGNGYSLQFVNPLSFDAAGCCRMYPAKNSDMGTRFAWFVAGGILVQAVYILLALTLSFALNLPMVWATLGVSCVYACYLFLVNVLPFEGSEGVYDGALLWGLCRRDPSARTFVALLTAQGEMFFGKTPGEVGETLLFDLPQLPEDDPSFSRLQYYRYLYFLDRGERESAVRSITRLEDCLEYILPEERLSVFAELTYAYSFFLGDKWAAEQYHARMQRERGADGLSLRPEEGSGAEVLRAQMAYALLSGETGRAETLAKAHRRAAEKEPLEGMRRLEIKLSQELYGG